MNNITIEWLKSEKVLTGTGKISPKYKHYCVGSVLDSIIDRTSYLEESISLVERLYNIIFDIHEVCSCACGNVLKFRLTGRFRLTYQTHCSPKCSNNDNTVKQRKKESAITHYGVDNISQSEEIKQKKKKTNIAKRGVEYSLQDPTIRESIRQTNLSKYGVEHPAQNVVVREKTKQTNLERYGVETPYQSELIKDKIKKTNVQRYGVEFPIQSQIIKDRAKVTNLERYGVEYPAQTENHKSKKRQTNLRKIGVSTILQLPEFRCELKRKHNELHGVEYNNQKHLGQVVIRQLSDKSWIHNIHFIEKKSVQEIAMQLSCHYSTVYNYISKHGFQVQHYKHSIGEQTLYDFVASIIDPIHIIRNDRQQISPYELDIYVPQSRLAIEYCGLYWHSEQLGRGRQYHKMKHDRCKQLGIRLITLFEDEWIDHPNTVKSKICTLLAVRTLNATYARSTTVHTLSKAIKSNFFKRYHIQGNSSSSIDIGLIHNDVLVACMSFIKQQDHHVLCRYATSCPVPGGFSKLLKYFKTQFDWSLLVSFADQRWSDGNLYTKTGWTFDCVIPPDYSYINTTKNIRIHKFNYRRKQLPNRLPNFNPMLSEWENCKANGVLRIWDCGKLRYVIHNT